MAWMKLVQSMSNPFSLKHANLDTHKVPPATSLPAPQARSSSTYFLRSCCLFLLLNPNQHMEFSMPFHMLAYYLFQYQQWDKSQELIKRLPFAREGGGVGGGRGVGRELSLIQPYPAPWFWHIFICSLVLETMSSYIVIFYISLSQRGSSWNEKPRWFPGLSR